MVDLSRITPQASSAYERLMQSWGGPLSVTSGYRSPEYNQRVGGAKQSQHVHGNAYDVSTQGMTRDQQLELIRMAQASGFGGVGVYDGSLHFDVGPQRTWGPDYTRKSLPDWAASALGVSSGGGADMVSGGDGGDRLMDGYGNNAQPRGLLEMLGIQKRDEAAGGETAMPFYQRGSFKDTMGNLAVGLNSLRLNPDPNLAARVSGRQKDRQEAAKANRTVDFLSKQQGADIYIQMLNAGASPSSVLTQYQSDLQAAAKSNQPKPIEYKEIGGKLVAINPNDQTVTEVYGTGSLTNDQISTANVLRDDLRTELGSFNLVRSGYQTIQDLYENSGSVSDYALAVGFAKILDPTSVAREGEVAAIAGAGDLPSSIRSQVINALNGTGSLPPQVRQQIAEIATRRYDREAQRATSYLDRYKTAAEQAGVPWEQVWMGGDIASSSPVSPQGAPTLPNGSITVGNRTFTQSEINAAWPNMSPDVRRSIQQSIGG